MTIKEAYAEEKIPFRKLVLLLLGQVLRYLGIVLDL
jgi:hypothetical protein